MWVPPEIAPLAAGPAASGPLSVGVFVAAPRRDGAVPLAKARCDDLEKRRPFRFVRAAASYHLPHTPRERASEREREGERAETPTGFLALPPDFLPSPIVIWTGAYTPTRHFQRHMTPCPQSIVTARVSELRKDAPAADAEVRN